MSTRWKNIAITITNNTCEWLAVGMSELHRDDDRPAVIFSSGTKEWWICGWLSRNDDKPAVIHSDGTKEWWVKGKRHRNNKQPAIVYPSGREEWWVNNVHVHWHFRNEL